MIEIDIYTDGACLGNPGPGGWGYIIEYKGANNKKSGGQKNTTNNQMELRAIIEAVGALKEPCFITIYSDSKYCVDGINSWMKGWIAKGWTTASRKPVANKDMWLEYLQVQEKHTVSCVWVKGHAGHYQNEICDKMASKEAAKIKGK